MQRPKGKPGTGHNRSSGGLENHSAGDRFQSTAAIGQRPLERDHSPKRSPTAWLPWSASDPTGTSAVRAAELALPTHSGSPVSLTFHPEAVVGCPEIMRHLRQHGIPSGPTDGRPCPPWESLARTGCTVPNGRATDGAVCERSAAATRTVKHVLRDPLRRRHRWRIFRVRVAGLGRFLTTRPHCAAGGRRSDQGFRTSAAQCRDLPTHPAARPLKGINIRLMSKPAFQLLASKVKLRVLVVPALSTRVTANV